MAEAALLAAVPSAPPPIVLRPWSETDCVERLTAMLHQAFEPLRSMGLACASGTQSSAQTSERLRQGHCLVAEANLQVISALVIYGSRPASEAQIYRSADVASIHQFAVHPDWHGRGVGHALLGAAEQWALCRGYRAMALDTPSAALHLLSYYRRRGYRPVEVVRFAARPYESTLLCKALADSASPAYRLPIVRP